MILRSVMLDADNPYPIGAEQLGQLILEVCLAAAERNFEERVHVHEDLYLKMLPLAIEKDKERSTATSLGRDGSVSFNRFGDDYRARELRMGSVYLDGDLM